MSRSRFILTILTTISIAAVAPADRARAECDWVLQNNSLQTDWALAVYPIDRNIAWVNGYCTAGYPRYPVLTLDGGITWLQDRGAPGDGQTTALFAFDDRFCFAATEYPDGYRIFRTMDSGVSWQQVFQNYQFINAIHFFDRQNGWVMADPVAGRFGILTTSDGGRTWTPSPTAPVEPPGGAGGIWDSYSWVGSQICVFGTNANYLLRTSNGGLSWQAIPCDIGWPRKVVLNERGYGLVAGWNLTPGAPGGALRRTTDFGQTWHAVPGILELDQVYTVELVPGTSEAWAFGWKEDPYFWGWLHSTNNGVSWSPCPDLTDNYEGRDCEFVPPGGGSPLHVTGWSVGIWLPDSSPKICRYDVVVGIEPVAVPAATRLALRASPNPFSPLTVLDLEVPEGRGASLRIYDSGGHLVRTLDRGPLLPGRRSVRWDGYDDRGSPVASGVYLVRLGAGNEAVTQKLVLTR